MTRSIDRFIPPMESLVQWSGGFTIEECDKIIEIGELCEFQKARIGSGDSGVTDESIRKTDIVWIEPKEEWKWIFERMNQIVAKVNFDKFQLDLNRFDGFQYSVYKNNGFYDWHIDTFPDPIDGQWRKLSCVLSLTDPDTYEGGDLVLSPQGNNENKIDIYRPSKGTVSFFYSHTPHKVTPVTKGTRITLVTWCLGDKIR